MKEIYFTLLILWAIDTILTYINLNRFIKLNPKKDWINLEINPINRIIYKKHGLDKGTALLSINIFLIAILLNFITDIMFYILCGMYLMLIIMHIDFYNKQKEKSKIDWRKYTIFILLILSSVDLSLTFVYLDTYKTWQPDKSFNQMESNPMILFFINLFGLETGLLISGIVIWLALYILGKKADWYVIIPVALVLLFAIIINSIHLTYLHKLMILYPNG